VLGAAERLSFFNGEFQTTTRVTPLRRRRLLLVPWQTRRRG